MRLPSRPARKDPTCLPIQAVCHCATERWHCTDAHAWLMEHTGTQCGRARFTKILRVSEKCVKIILEL